MIEGGKEGRKEGRKGGREGGPARTWEHAGVGCVEVSGDEGQLHACVCMTEIEIRQVRILLLHNSFCCCLALCLCLCELRPHAPSFPSPFPPSHPFNPPLLPGTGCIPHILSTWTWACPPPMRTRSFRYGVGSRLREGWGGW
jgi:hypothetical protein